MGGRAQGRGFITKSAVEKTLLQGEREPGASGLLDQKRWSEAAWEGTRGGEGWERDVGRGGGAGVLGERDLEDGGGDSEKEKGAKRVY